MSEDRERLEDLNIAEAAGHDTPPDLTARILAAAKHNSVDDAATPISGIHSVPHSIRPPQGRRMTASVRPARKRNWQGAGFVVVASLLITVSLVAFILTKQPSPADPDEPETAEQSDGGDEPEPTNDKSVPQGNQPEPDDQPGSTPDDRPAPEDTPYGPDEPVEEPKPDQDEPVDHDRPVPDDVVDEPNPDNQPESTEPEEASEEVVDEPKKGDPAKDDGTVVKPKKELVAVGSTRGTEARETFVRATVEDDWKDAVLAGDPVWVYDGGQIKSRGGAATLTNGAYMTLDGEVSLHTHTSGLRVELTDDDLYLDNFATTSPVWITRDELEVEVGEGVVVVESSSSRFEILCVDGEVTAAGKLIPAGHKATLSKRGLSSIKAFHKRDWSNPMIGGTALRQLGIEEFDEVPAGGMISGRIETRTKDQLEDYDDGHVAIDEGPGASVAFMFDGEHKTLRGEILHVRYRATGAQKLILQMFCPERNDNFGFDLAPEEDGEWHVAEIPLKTLRDRVSHSIAPEPGTVLSSFTLTLRGNDDAQLEVDWVELVRAPDFGE